jgi:hypothetical protein
VRHLRDQRGQQQVGDGHRGQRGMGWKVADWMRLPTLVSSTTPMA